MSYPFNGLAAEKMIWEWSLGLASHTIPTGPEHTTQRIKILFKKTYKISLTMQ